MRIKINKSLILNDIKRYKKFNSDAEFARFLEIKPQTLASWHSRNTFDIELLYAKCEDLNPEWLLTGKGKMLKEVMSITQKGKGNVNNGHNIQGNKNRIEQTNDELLEIIKKKDEQIAEKDEQIKTLLELLKTK